MSGGNPLAEPGPVRDAARVIEREATVRAVEEQLRRDYQQWRAMSADVVRATVVHVEGHELAWIVSWQSEEFVRTRDSKYALIGNGPYLIDRVDGGLHQIGVRLRRDGRQGNGGAPQPGACGEDRSRWRGVPNRLRPRGVTRRQASELIAMGGDLHVVTARRSGERPVRRRSRRPPHGRSRACRRPGSTSRPFRCRWSSLRRCTWRTLSSGPRRRRCRRGLCWR